MSDLNDFILSCTAQAEKEAVEVRRLDRIINKALEVKQKHVRNMQKYLEMAEQASRGMEKEKPKLRLIKKDE